LLNRDPQRRLGAGKTDAEEVKGHAFFKDVNFDDVLNKRIPPPYFPTIVCLRYFYFDGPCRADGYCFQNGSADTSNFDEEFTKEQPTLTPVHGQLSSRDQAEFNGFSWVCCYFYNHWFRWLRIRYRWHRGPMYKVVLTLLFVIFFVDSEVLYLYLNINVFPSVRCIPLRPVDFINIGIA
jgi:Protein kinase C terminal domain